MADLEQLPIKDDVDLVIVRRSLLPADLSKFLEATLASETTYRGETWRFGAYDRYVLYLTASQTGLRARELSLLRPTDLRLDGDRPELKARASIAKNAKTRRVPLLADLVPILRAYLEGRPADRPVWPGVWARDGWGVRMVRADLAAAGIDFKNGAGERFDFHSLRVQCGTDLARAGFPLVYAQQFLRHSTPTLTAR